MLRQAKNICTIEGILAEQDIKYGSYIDKSTGATVDNIGGTIKVLVNQTINGEVVPMQIPIHMFSPRMTKKGTINPSYESIERCMKEYKSIASTGNIDTADKVRITGGYVRMNEYYDTTGRFISFPRIHTSFVSRVTNNFQPKASFEMEFAVSSMDFVTDAEGVEVDPKKLRIKVLVPYYGGKVDTIELFTVVPAAIDSITTYWEEGKTYSAIGRLNFSSTTREIVEEHDFGEPEIRTQTVSVSELLITGGSTAPLEDGMAFEPAELAAALKEHKAYLESLKDKVNNRMKATPAPTSFNQQIDLGF